MHSKFFGHFTKIIQKSKIKAPLTFRPLCSNWIDHGLSTSLSPERVSRCLDQKEFKHYISKVETTQFEINHSMGMAQFSLSFSENIRVMHKEVPVFDEIGLVGSLGGALGLFRGRP